MKQKDLTKTLWLFQIEKNPFVSLVYEILETVEVFISFIH